MRVVRRGEVYYADLGENTGSEQNGVRPVLVIQNNEGNRYSPTTIIAPITSKADSKTHLPTHVRINRFNVLEKDSLILCEQVKTIDKTLLDKLLGTLNKRTMRKVNVALAVSMIPGLTEFVSKNNRK